MQSFERRRKTFYGLNEDTHKISIPNSRVPQFDFNNSVTGAAVIVYQLSHSDVPIRKAARVVEWRDASDLPGFWGAVAALDGGAGEATIFALETKKNVPTNIIIYNT